MTNHDIGSVVFHWASFYIFKTWHFLEISRKTGVASRKGLDASRVNTQISDVIPAIDPLSGEFLSVPIGVEDDPECTPNPN